MPEFISPPPGILANIGSAAYQPTHLPLKRRPVRQTLPEQQIGVLPPQLLVHGPLPVSQNVAPIPRETIDRIVAQLERLMEDARDKWTIPKRARTDKVHSAAWRSREVAYRDALRLLADVGLAPERYASS